MPRARRITGRCRRDEQAAGDVAGDDQVRGREDVRAPGPVESARRARIGVVGPEHARLLGVPHVEEVDALRVVRQEQAVAVDQHVVGDGGAVGDELRDLARRRRRRDVPTLHRLARALVGREQVAPVARHPGVVGEAAPGEEARDLARAARVADVDEGLEAVVDGGGEEHVAARVGIVDVVVGEGADLRRVLRVGSDVEDRASRRSPARWCRSRTGARGRCRSTGECALGRCGSGSGSSAAAIRVPHADDVESPGRLGGHVDVVAVGADLRATGSPGPGRARSAAAARDR